MLTVHLPRSNFTKELQVFNWFCKTFQKAFLTLIISLQFNHNSVVCVIQLCLICLRSPNYIFKFASDKSLNRCLFLVERGNWDLCYFLCFNVLLLIQFPCVTLLLFCLYVVIRRAGYKNGWTKMFSSLTRISFVCGKTGWCCIVSLMCYCFDIPYIVQYGTTWVWKTVYHFDICLLSKGLYPA